jgi:hypothetical protein
VVELNGHGETGQYQRPHDIAPIISDLRFQRSAATPAGKARSA